MHKVEAKGILSSQNGMNIFRGCSHGCIYCDSRSNCYQIKHDFEDIEIKVNAPNLLEDALRKKRKKCMIGTGAMTDPYIPLEEQLQYTRRCLEIIDQYDFGLAIQTKSKGILRDLDLLQKIHKKTKCVVQMTMTTYNEELCKKVEPFVSTTKERFETLKVFRDHGIPTIVWLSPILPFINDNEENIMGILEYCREAKVKGIICFSMGMTLREGNREYYYQQLDKGFPGLKDRYMNSYGNSYEVLSPNNRELMQLFYDYCRKYKIETDINKIFAFMKKFEENSDYEQLSLF